MAKYIELLDKRFEKGKTRRRWTLVAESEVEARKKEGWLTREEAEKLEKKEAK